MREAAAATDGERGRERERVERGCGGDGWRERECVCVFIRKAVVKRDLVKRDLKESSCEGS